MPDDEWLQDTPAMYQTSRNWFQGTPEAGHEDKERAVGAS